MLRTFSWYVWLEVLSRASRRHMMHLSTSLCKPKMRHFGALPQKLSHRRDAKNGKRGFSESLMPQKKCQYQPHITQDEYIRKNRVAFCVERGICLAGISTQKKQGLSLPSCNLLATRAAGTSFDDRAAGEDFRQGEERETKNDRLQGASSHREDLGFDGTVLDEK